AVIEASGLACAWDIPAAAAGRSFDRTKVNVQYTVGGAAASLLQVPTQASCADRAAWYYDDTFEPKQILACPAACAVLQTDASARVDVIFGCESQLAPE